MLESRAPFRPASFDASKNKKSPIRIRTTIDAKYAESLQEIEDLAQDYFKASQKAFQFSNFAEARSFVDEAMLLLAGFKLDVPEEFITLNAEILSKFPAD